MLNLYEYWEWILGAKSAKELTSANKKMGL